MTKIVIILGLIFFAQNAYSQNPPFIKAAAAPAAKPKDPPPGLTLSISYYSGSLNFGKFYKNTGGTITLDPITGNPIPSGDIIILNPFSSNAVFEVFATKNKNVIITAPSIILTGTGTNNSSDELELSLQFDQSVFQTLSDTTPVYINMGGILTVDSLDKPGPYSGTVVVSINFE